MRSGPTAKGPGKPPVPSAGGVQRAKIIPERDVYRLIMRSKLPTAEAFEEWVTGEVLPSIRKTGGYLVAAPEETPEELALRALTVLQATVARQKAQLAAAQPKADAFDRLDGTAGSMCVTAAAKVLKVGPRELSAYLRQNGWTYRRPGASAVLGYQLKISAGLLEHKATTIARPDGTEKVVRASAGDRERPRAAGDASATPGSGCLSKIKTRDSALLLHTL